MAKDYGIVYWERRLIVPFKTLRASNNCQICKVIANAISVSRTFRALSSRLSAVFAIERDQYILATWMGNESSDLEC